MAPTALYIGPGEQMRVTIFSSAAGAYLKVQGRILQPPGIVVPFTELFYPTPDRVQCSYQFELPEGWLLGLRCRSDTVFSSGRMYTYVDLVKGHVNTANVLHQLTAGYVSSSREVSWPYGTNEAPRSGPGWIRSVVGTNPAAGVEISETVPTSAHWRLVSFLYALATSATAANRYSSLKILDPSYVVVQIDPPALQPASTNHLYNYGPSLPSRPLVIRCHLSPLPENLVLRPGWVITTFTDDLQAGDDYSPPFLIVEEWIES